MLTSDAGRKAWRRPRAAPSTLAAGTLKSGAAPGSPGAGSGAGNGECLMMSRFSTASISLSVPNPKRLVSPFDDA